MKTEAQIVADSIIEQYGPADTPEQIEVLADELMLAPNAYEDGPEAARDVAAELRRRALRLRNA